MKQLIVAALVLISLPSISQVAYKKPALENPKSFSIIMVPDVQNYAKWGRNQPVMDLMFAWIADNLDTLNVKMVVGVGDLVENSEKITNDYDGDQTTRQQWESVSRAFAKLDGRVPYMAPTGNHDYSISSKGGRSSAYTEYFNTERNHLNQKYLVQNSRNEAELPTLENSAYELKGLNGRDYLFLMVEFGPRDTVLSWAKRVAAMEQYKNHRIVLATHNYLDNKDKHTAGEVKWLYWEPYNVDNQIQKSPQIPLPFANSGKQIFEKLVKPSKNIELVLSGHVAGEGYRSDKNNTGTTVHQILFDAQDMGGGHRNGNGGDGWLRILEFFPDSKTVMVKTFSPLFGISPSTRQFAWKTDPRNEYTIRFD